MYAVKSGNLEVLNILLNSKANIADVAKVVAHKGYPHEICVSDCFMESGVSATVRL